MMVMPAFGICRRSREANASPAAPAPAMTMRAFAEDVAALTLESPIPFAAVTVAPAKRNCLLFTTRLLLLDDGSRAWGSLLRTQSTICCVVIAPAVRASS